MKTLRKSWVELFKSTLLSIQPSVSDVKILSTTITTPSEWRVSVTYFIPKSTQTKFCTNNWCKIQWKVKLFLIIISEQKKKKLFHMHSIEHGVIYVNSLLDKHGENNRTHPLHRRRRRRRRRSLLAFPSPPFASSSSFLLRIFPLRYFYRFSRLNCSTLTFRRQSICDDNVLAYIGRYKRAECYSCRRQSTRDNIAIVILCISIQCHKNFFDNCLDYFVEGKCE